MNRDGKQLTKRAHPLTFGVMGCAQCTAAPASGPSSPGDRPNGSKRTISPQKLSAKYRLADASALGSGNFSVVRRGVHKASKQPVAIKCFTKDGISQDDEDAVFTEVLVLSKVSAGGGQPCLRAPLCRPGPEHTCFCVLIPISAITCWHCARSAPPSCRASCLVCV